MMKKKKYKFQVNFLLEDLTSVPFVNGVLFAKVRLLDGGTFSEVSKREEVKDHQVQWNLCCKFCCKMSANASTGILDPCCCRISVRRESKGGRSFHKLGFVDLNLAEFAGAGTTSRRYLLEGYDAKHRQDNSILKVTLDMTLLSGDPCFKAPSYRESALPGEKLVDSSKQNSSGSVLKKGDNQSTGGGSVASVSSGFGSLPRKQRPSVLNSDFVAGGTDGSSSTTPQDDTPTPLATPTGLEAGAAGLSSADFELGHSRNSSYASQQSKASGYSSMHSHSRQNSGESGHMRNPSSGSTYSDMGLSGPTKSIDRKRPPGRKQICEESRMDSTRVNANQLIDELFENTNFDQEGPIESCGLRLVINKDGTAALRSQGSKDGSGVK